MSNYQRDQAWETSWLPTVMDCIKSRHILKQAPIEEDRERVADIMPSLLVRQIRIGVRVRRPNSYFERYKHEVTFRAKRDTGARTEFAKIIGEEAWGDLMFYAWGSEEDKKFLRWTLVSLHAVRRIVKSRNPALILQANGDGTYFHPVNIELWHGWDSRFIIDSNWFSNDVST